jgi:acyl-CoA thioesterase
MRGGCKLFLKLLQCGSVRKNVRGRLKLINLDEYKEYFNKNDRFSIFCGMELTEIREGYAKVELTIDENSMNYMGSMHGGLIYTMADVAAGTAVVSRGKQGVTLGAHTEYIKPALSGKVIAEGKVISPGKTISRCEVEIHSEDGTLYAKSYITMFTTNRDVTLATGK